MAVQTSGRGTQSRTGSDSHNGHTKGWTSGVNSNAAARKFKSNPRTRDVQGSGANGAISDRRLTNLLQITKSFPDFAPTNGERTFIQNYRTNGFIRRGDQLKLERIHQEALAKIEKKVNVLIQRLQKINPNSPLIAQLISASEKLTQGSKVDSDLIASSSELLKAAEAEVKTKAKPARIQASNLAEPTQLKSGRKIITNVNGEVVDVIEPKPVKVKKEETAVIEKNPNTGFIGTMWGFRPTVHKQATLKKERSTKFEQKKELARKDEKNMTLASEVKALLEDVFVKLDKAGYPNLRPGITVDLKPGVGVASVLTDKNKVIPGILDKLNELNSLYLNAESLIKAKERKELLAGPATNNRDSMWHAVEADNNLRLELANFSENEIHDQAIGIYTSLVTDIKNLKPSVIKLNAPSNEIQELVVKVRAQVYETHGQQGLDRVFANDIATAVPNTKQEKLIAEKLAALDLIERVESLKVKHSNLVEMSKSDSRRITEVTKALEELRRAEASLEKYTEGEVDLVKFVGAIPSQIITSLDDQIDAASTMVTKHTDARNSAASLRNDNSRHSAIQSNLHKAEIVQRFVTTANEDYRAIEILPAMLRRFDMVMADLSDELAKASHEDRQVTRAEYHEKVIALQAKISKALGILVNYLDRAGLSEKNLEAAEANTKEAAIRESLSNIKSLIAGLTDRLDDNSSELPRYFYVTTVRDEFVKIRNLVKERIPVLERANRMLDSKFGTRTMHEIVANADARGFDGAKLIKLREELGTAVRNDDSVKAKELLSEFKKALITKKPELA